MNSTPAIRRRARQRNKTIARIAAHDVEEYFSINVQLARDFRRLSEIRGVLRQRLSAISLFDGPRVTRSVEEAFRCMWVDHVQSQRREPARVDRHSIGRARHCQPILADGISRRALCRCGIFPCVRLKRGLELAKAHGKATGMSDIDGFIANFTTAVDFQEQRELVGGTVLADLPEWDSAIRRSPASRLRIAHRSARPGGG